MWHNRSSLLGKFQITIWAFPNSELQETHFHAFYPHTSLLWWRIFLNYIILIFFLESCIVLYLRFSIFGWSASKIYGRYMWMDSLPVRFKIHCLESFCVCGPPRNIMSSILLVVINISSDLPLLLIVCKVFLSCVVRNCI